MNDTYEKNQTVETVEAVESMESDELSEDDLEQVTGGSGTARVSRTVT